MKGCLIRIKLKLLWFFITNYDYYGDTRWSWLSDGWITAGLCPNHPWVLSYWVENPFFMFVLEIVIVWGDMGKPMNTIMMLDTCGMNNNNNDNIVSFVLFKNHHVIYYLLTTMTALLWVQRDSLPIAGDRGLIPRDGAIDRRYFFWAIDSNSMF